jgi:hypothetical protein
MATTIPPILERQWAFVATTLTAAELAAVCSPSPVTQLPQALAYRRMKRQAMLQHDLERFRRIIESEKALPVETRRENRIRRLKELYGIAERSPTPIQLSKSGGTLAQSGSSWAIPTEVEADQLVEWTMHLDTRLLSPSPLPLDGITPPSSPIAPLGLWSPLYHGSEPRSTAGL